MRGRAIDLWRRLRLTRPRIDTVVYIETPADVPDDIERQTLIVVGNRTFQKWAVFECPCGRGHRLAVSLQRSHRPSWRLTFDDRGPSLFPSIDSVADWRCHFWLRGGRVRWVRRFPRQRRTGPSTHLRSRKPS